MRKCLFLILVVSICNFGFAQDDRENRLGFGIGPSKMYGDNTGIHSDFRFMVLPAASVDFSKKINTLFDVKATLGWQMINSGDFYSERLKERISRADQPLGFNGNAFFLDVMPIVHFNPNQSGYLPSLIKVYTGLGLGLVHSARTETQREYTNFEVPELNTFDEYSYSASSTGLYFPWRVGIFKELEGRSAEIGLEATIMISPFVELDGNSKQQKRLGPDALMQFQFFYRINLGDW
ncbi:hypothetical protein [Pleomorphovibrio marinus]|uniref:hypothetical protein n=1 Tax=Pleomorphovibrio marinus TaxID=2164132 RepID=UPI000E0C8F6D|nr:hypothetical protein [Pleomorphovibrio marinus]